MSILDSLLSRNKQFAATVASTGTPMPSLPESLPHVKALIIGCADMRVDPAQVLGFDLGEAVVLRNIGGRITPGLVEQLGLLGRIGQVAEAIPGGGGEFHIVILHHTDCGITRLAKDTSLLAHYFQIPEPDVASKTVLDPHNAVTMDVAALRAITALPASWIISGLVYNTTTGLAEVVVPPAPLRAE
jgi:carbonic anhydrase